MLLELERQRSPGPASPHPGGGVAAVPHEPATGPGDGSPLKILHVFRAPIGGLFRHVIDLSRAQAARGHRVGLVFDSTTGDPKTDAALAEIAPLLAFGIRRLPIKRQLSFSDIACLRHVAARIGQVAPDVVHGHGAKGAAYARLATAAKEAVRAYTPHGGSLVYRPGTLAGLFYRSLEWLLIPRTDLFLFESMFANNKFQTEIGRPRSIVRIAANGVGTSEFAPIAQEADATDIVFIGELRPVKGVDTLIDALARLRAAGRRLSATIVGDGPDRAQLMAQAQERGLGQTVRFAGVLPARQAFARGRLMVMPSRAESLPYVALEAAAAAIAMVATDVGGVSEIFGPLSRRLIPANDPAALAHAIASAFDNPADTQAATAQLQDRVRTAYSIDGMAEAVLAGYRAALAARLQTIG